MFKKSLTIILTLLLVLGFVPARKALAEEDLHAYLSNEMVLNWVPYEGSTFDHYEIKVYAEDSIIASTADLDVQALYYYDLKNNPAISSYLAAMADGSTVYIYAKVIATTTTGFILGESDSNQVQFMNQGIAVPAAPLDVKWHGNAEDGYSVNWYIDEDDMDYLNSIGGYTSVYLHDVTGGEDKIITASGGSFYNNTQDYGNTLVPGHQYRVDVHTNAYINGKYYESPTASSAVLTVEGSFDPAAITFSPAIDEAGIISWDYSTLPTFTTNIRLVFYKDGSKITTYYYRRTDERATFLVNYIKSTGGGLYTVEATLGNGNQDESFVALTDPITISKTFSSPEKIKTPTDIKLVNGLLEMVSGNYTDVTYGFMAYAYDESFPNNYDETSPILTVGSSYNYYSILDYYTSGKIANGDKLIVECYISSDSAKFLDSDSFIKELTFDVYKLDSVKLNFTNTLRVGDHMSGIEVTAFDPVYSSALKPADFELSTNYRALEYSTSGLDGTWNKLSYYDELTEGYYRYRLMITESSTDHKNNPWIEKDLVVTGNGLTFRYDGGAFGQYGYSSPVSSSLEVVSDSFYLSMETASKLEVVVENNIPVSDIQPGVTHIADVLGTLKSVKLTTDGGTYELKDNSELYITDRFGSIVPGYDTFEPNSEYTFWLVVNDDYKTLWTTADVEFAGLIKDWQMDACTNKPQDEYLLTKIFKTPAEVKELKYAGSTATMISLSWDDFADSYEVYRSETGVNGTYIYKGAVGIGEYNDFGVDPGKTYSYKVRGFVDDEMTSYTNIVTAAALPELVPGVEATEVNSTYVTLHWNAVDVDSTQWGYKVYRSTSENGKYSAVATVSSPATSATVLKLKPDTTYYYKVTAFSKIGTKTYESPLAASSPIKVKTAMTAPVVSAAAGHREVTLTWKPVPNAIMYSIRKSTAGSAYETVSTSYTDTKYYDDTLANGISYKYEIVAISADNKSTPAVVEVTPSLTAMKIDKVLPDFYNNAIAIYCNTPWSISTFKAYIGTSAKGPFVEVSGSDIHEYSDYIGVDYGFEYGKTYYVQIVPVEAGIEGPKSNTAVVKYTMVKPTITCLSAGSGSFDLSVDLGFIPYQAKLETSTDKITWSSIGGVSGYTSTFSSSYSISDLSKPFYARVTALDKDDRTIASDIKTFKYVMPTPTLEFVQKSFDSIDIKASVNGRSYNMIVYMGESSADLKAKMAANSPLFNTYLQTATFAAGGLKANTVYYFAVVLEDNMGNQKVVNKTFKVNVPAPTLSKVSVVDAERVAITFKPVSYTNVYRILTSVDNVSYDVAVYDFYVPSGSTLVTKEWNGKIGTARYFKVEPVVYGTAPCSKAKSIKGAIKAPSVKSAVVSGPREVTLTFAPSKGEPSMYFIYRKDGNAAAEMIGVVYGKTTYVDHDIDYNGNYSYAVEARYPYGSQSSMSSFKKVAVKYPAPEFHLTACADGSITITTYYSDVAGYEVYASNSAKGTFELIRTMSVGNASMTYPSGTTVYYKLRSYAYDSAGNKIYSPFSAVKSATAR